MNIVGQEITSDEITNYDIQLEMNEVGLISSYSVTEKEYYRATGNMKSIAPGSVSLSYDSDNHLIEVRGNGYREKYNEDGTLKEIEEIQTELVYTWSEENLKSRKIVSREKENGEWIEKTYTEEYNHGPGMNVTRQPFDSVFEEPFEGLYNLGLFGVGSKNFRVNVTSYTLNSNGTVDTVGSHKYIYK